MKDVTQELDTLLANVPERVLIDEINAPVKQSYWLQQLYSTRTSNGRRVRGSRKLPSF